MLAGFLDGGDGDELFSVTQDGSDVAAAFTDRAGNDVSMVGTYGALGNYRGQWTVTNGSRTLVLDAIGHGDSQNGNRVVDGSMEVLSDTDGSCVGLRLGFWSVIDADSAPEPEPQVKMAFVGRGYSSDIDVIDVETMTLITTIAGAGGYRMVLTPDGTKLYTTGAWNLVYVVDTTTFTFTSFDPSTSFETIASPSELEAIAINPAGTRVYVVDEQGNAALFVIDTATDMVIDAVELPEVDEPENAVVSPDGRFLFVVDNSEALKIDVDEASATYLQIVDRVEVESDAHGVALSADGSRLYANGASGGIDVIDTTTMTVLANIAGADGYYLEAGKAGTRIYGVNESTTLSVMDAATQTLVQNVSLSSGSARGISTSRDGTVVLVATSGGLIRIDSAMLMETGTYSGPAPGFQSVEILE